MRGFYYFPLAIADSIFRSVQFMTQLRLLLRISSSYLEMGKRRMARIYAERVYGPVCGFRDLVYDKTAPLQVEPESLGSALYSEVMYIAAKISYAEDNITCAEREIDEAKRLQPSDDQELRRKLQNLKNKISERMMILTHRQTRRQKGLENRWRHQDEAYDGEWTETSSDQFFVIALILLMRSLTITFLI